MPISAPPPSWASIKNKPNTVSGFGITDMASQSVANATNVTNVTTAQVGNAMAGLSAGAVGSTCNAFVSGANIGIGGTVAGSSLVGLNTSGGYVSTGFGGTWRNLGAQSVTNAGSYAQVTCFIRIA